MAHTPGPWKKWERWEHDCDDTEYPDNIELGQESGFRIATVWNTPRQDARANAALIAAAPDLLAACESLLAVYAPLYHPSDVTDAFSGAVIAARAAIAKARAK